MNEEKSKIIAELADYVRSDLPVQEIIDNFQYLIQKLDYTNRVAAITKATAILQSLILKQVHSIQQIQIELGQSPKTHLEHITLKTE